MSDNYACPECGHRVLYICVDATLKMDFETGEWKIEPDSIDYDEDKAYVVCANDADQCEFNGPLWKCNWEEGIGGRQVVARRDLEAAEEVAQRMESDRDDASLEHEAI